MSAVRASDTTYLPGSWFAVVSPRAVVLLEGSVSPSRLEAVWEASGGEPSLDELIEVVTGGRFVGAPFFGIGLVDGAGLRVVVRAGVRAVVGESVGAARSIVSGNANTWVEEILEQPQPIRLIRDGGSTGALSLPVRGGVVFADEVTWTPSLPAPNRPPRRASADVPELRGLTVPITPFVRAEHIPSVETRAPAPAAPAAPADPNDSEWSVWALDEAGELPGPIRGDDSPPVPIEPVVLPGEEPGVPLPNDRPPLLPEDRPDSWLESRPPVADERPPAAADLTVRALPTVSAVPTLGYLHFASGQVVPLDRPVVLGRAPSADSLDRPGRPRRVQIDNVDPDISRNHVEVRFEGDYAFIVDLNSANGTIVTIPGQAPQHLEPEEPFPLVVGSVVTLSEEISFRYQAAE